MEAGESSDTSTERRKRTESSSGSSDSDLSDGWNIVDHLDVHSTDAPSSDGESVEVIDTESAFHDEEEEEYRQPEGENNQLMLKPETPVVTADQGVSSVGSPSDRPLALPQAREETFHSSFSWFLFFAVSAVLVSDVALMVAESVLDWNVGVSKYANQPSFLSDLPVAPKLPTQEGLPSKMAWANKEDVTVDSVEINGEEVIEKFEEATGEPLDSNHKYNYGFKENRQKLPLTIDNHDIGKYFTGLNEVTVSKDAQNKLSQTLLILDALHVGLNDLEDVVTKSPELRQVLSSQKELLVNAVAEIQSGVSRSMEKVATNVLDKVQRLERNFEIQWCRLEKAGHKDELKGLFYDCHENEEKYMNYDQKNQFDEKSVKKNKFVKDSYQYEVDRDSTGKEYNRYENNKENYVHNEFVKSEKHAKNKYDHDSKKNKAHTRSPGLVDPYTHEKANNFDGMNEYEKKYKQDIFRENGEYQNVEKQTKNDINSLNKEQHISNNQKLAKYENSAESYHRISVEEKDNKYSKPDYKRSGSEIRNDQTKTFENQRYEDKKSKQYKKSEQHEKSANFEHTKSKKEHYRNEENPEKLEHVRSDPKYSENYEKSNKYENNVKFENSNDHNNHKEKFSNNFNNKEKDLNKKYYDAKNYQNTNPPSDESKYEKSDHNKKQDPNNFLNAAAEKLGKYLKEKCDKNRQKTTELYNKLKDGVKEKIKVPLEIFNSMFSKYCSTNKNNQKKDEYKKEQLKGEYKRNNHDRKMMSLNDDMITVEEITNIKNSANVKLGYPRKENGPHFGKKDKNIVELSDKLSQWTFNYGSPSLKNESNVEGDWFIKAGESRSKARWYQRRSDWLFDRASHRRAGVHSSPHHWLAGRRKNWFFRRAWAREQCRDTPDSYWCHPSQDETVTIPGASYS